MDEAKENRGEAPSSREFGRMVDHHRRIMGVWVQNAEDAEDPVTLSLYLRELGAPEALCHAALDGNISVSPNHRDSRGGYFVHKAWLLAQAPSRATAMGAFFASLVQLSLLLAAATVDSFLH